MLQQLEHDRQLGILYKHIDAGTILKRMKITVGSDINQPTNLKKLWDSAIEDCSKQLLDIIVTYHKERVDETKTERRNIKRQTPHTTITK